MTATPGTDWRKEFGIAGREPPHFFPGAASVGPATPQAHLLRRAFEALELDGVLCAGHCPLVYFKQVKRITAEKVTELHRLFWNHGGAPVLVLIGADRVHVYSGMSRPASDVPAHTDLPSLVETIDRAAEALQSFLTAVESGEFFRRHPQSFDPRQRVDRHLLANLKDARDKLEKVSPGRIPLPVLDALLCRLVFTCYLFDRGVIGRGYLDAAGFSGLSHLRDFLALRPPAEARGALYRLFHRLGEDFNGDLFSDDLDAEAALVEAPHVAILNDFFQGTEVDSGQRAFWPYDFGVIPIETISAIYEQFLKAEDQKRGAFYTPRFLAELVLDSALAGIPSLLGKTFFDPACGSGIFLVGLFNRLAEEWKQANLRARNDRRARELMRLLQESLFGVDVSETACRIAAFSLYLAYLDQLSPRDIQELQARGKALPRLIVTGQEAGNIRRADFFAEDVPFPKGASVVVGNPPWGSTATEETPAGRWCAAHEKPLPDKQIAAAFAWKAVEHVAEEGSVCFVLPTGVLFNHSTTAVPFQKAWVQWHALDRVMVLADFQRFLFDKAGHPAVVVTYRKQPPKDSRHTIDYWAPKADWMVTRAEVITVGPEDRSRLAVGDVLQDLDGPDAPQIWKLNFWATPRDRRLLERMSLYSRLRDVVQHSREKDTTKPWLMAEGYQPVGDNDDAGKARSIALPSRFFIDATSPVLDLFLLTEDCSQLDSATITVRNKSNKNTQVFRKPHVIVAKGYTSVAFADFDVSFRHALRGIHGPGTDRDLLIFLTAYLRTGLANHFLFHTSSNWGINRQEVHVEEVLRLPFPLPDQQPNPQRCREIVREVARIVTEAAASAAGEFADRAGIVRTASDAIEPLVEEYFDILPEEKLLIEDTVQVIIPSARPTRAKPLVPTIVPATAPQQQAYLDRLCTTLNGWAKRGPYAVRGQMLFSETLGLGMAALEKVRREEQAQPMRREVGGLLDALDRLRQAATRRHETLDLPRGVMVFDKNRLYVAKPIGRRNWTETAALNDADEIAGTLLMQPLKEQA
jgi:hypothetical protein